MSRTMTFTPIETAWEKEAYELRAIVEQAKKAILAAGHRATPRCNLLDMRATCNCGAVETFKIESGEFWRLIQMRKGSVPSPNPNEFPGQVPNLPSPNPNG